jgi:hypothetical protein
VNVSDHKPTVKSKLFNFTDLIEQLVYLQVCENSKMLVGGDGVTCNDGSLTYTALNEQPACFGQLSIY